MKYIAMRTLEAWDRERRARSRLQEHASFENLREWRRRHREARALERDWWSRGDRVL